MPERFLQSVDNALAILELFPSTAQELGVTDVSRLLGFGRSTAHRLLTTLENRGFVEQNSKTGKYRLGMKIVNIGASILSRLNIIKECHPCLEAISNETGATSHLALYGQGEVTFVDQVRQNPAIMSAVIGAKRPAYATGTGKVLLAYLPESELKKFLSTAEFHRFTANTVTSCAELRRCLQQIKEQGYGEDWQESEEGLVCFAAPIRDRTGDVVAAMSISGAASRMNARKEELLVKLKATAEQASRNCGWTPNYIWK